MKAKIFEIKRFAVHDGDGIRTTLFFKGCPLKCVWCHNPEGLKSESELAYYKHKCISCGECISVCPNGAHKMVNGIHSLNRQKCIACGKCVDFCFGEALKIYGQEMGVDELLPSLLKDKEFYDNSGGGVTISGGECLLYADFCAELLKELKANGIHTAVDTCGFVLRSAIDKVIPYTDIFLYDLKAFEEETHRKCTGQGNKAVLENLLYVDSKNVKIEVRIPYVPDFNDKEMAKIGEVLSQLKNLKKVRLLAYHNYAGSKYDSLDMVNTLPEKIPTEEELEKARKEIKASIGNKDLIVE